MWLTWIWILTDRNPWPKKLKSKEIRWPQCDQEMTSKTILTQGFQTSSTWPLLTEISSWKTSVFQIMTPIRNGRCLTTTRQLTQSCRMKRTPSSSTICLEIITWYCLRRMGIDDTLSIIWSDNSQLWLVTNSRMPFLNRSLLRSTWRRTVSLWIRSRKSISRSSTRLLCLL